MRLDKFLKLSRIIKRRTVSNDACDAGREGELIFRYIMQATKCKLPIKRLWLQSMTPAAIREAFAALRTDEQMLSLAEAARSRSEADWIVGISAPNSIHTNTPATMISPSTLNSAIFNTFFIVSKFPSGLFPYTVQQFLT